MVQVALAKSKPYLQNNQNVKSWRCGSSSIVSASTRGPQFKLQYHQKKKISGMKLMKKLYNLNCFSKYTALMVN
jgi:hypothetical protein